MKTQISQKRVCIIIVNWNGKSDTANCLSALAGIKQYGADVQVVVVDNGSTDGSLTHLRKKFPWASYVALPVNTGFTGGNNAGILYARENKADFIWFLNNDTIVDNNVLCVLSAFDDPGVGACGGKIYFCKGHEYHFARYKESDRGRVIWYAGGIIDWSNMYASHRGVDEVDHGQYDQKQDTPFITGCSFIVRSSILEKIGAFDNRFYLYLEDLDLSLRIQKAGWKTIYFPDFIVWHVNAGSSGRPGNPLHEYYFTRNRLLLGIRYAPLRTKFALVREAIRFLFGSSHERRKAVIDAFFGRFGKQYEPKNIS